jgi:hypothetical protein
MDFTNIRSPLVLLLALMFCFASNVTSREKTNESVFDYSNYADVLKNFVDDKGMVDYEGLKAESDQLDSFVNDLSGVKSEEYETWTKEQKIAFWLNAYNGLTLKVIIEHYPIESSWLKSLIYPKNSIRQIDGVWDEITHNVTGKKMTLEHIEHEILRKKFNEPRIHMALVCAAMGCPPLRREPYVGSRLDSQFDDQTRIFLSDPKKFKIDTSRNSVYVSSIFKWFAEDFGEKYGDKERIAGKSREESAVIHFIAQYLSKDKQEYLLNGKYRIKYLDYDWSLNEQQGESD